MSPINFELVKVLPSTTPGAIRVGGRCLTGSVKPGTRFSHLARGIVGNNVAVDLEVISLEMYGKPVEEVEEGCTATLLLAGTPADLDSEGGTAVLKGG